MTGGFNSSFIEIKTLEGDKFIRDLKIRESLVTSSGYAQIEGVFKRASKSNESVYNIYYHDDQKEGVLDRVSGDQIVLVVTKLDPIVINMKVKDLKAGIKLLSKDSVVTIDKIERMETVNRFFYNIDIGEGYYYADNICVLSEGIKNK